MLYVRQTFVKPYMVHWFQIWWLCLFFWLSVDPSCAESLIQLKLLCSSVSTEEATFWEVWIEWYYYVADPSDKLYCDHEFSDIRTLRPLCMLQVSLLFALAGAYIWDRQWFVDCNAQGKSELLFQKLMLEMSPFSLYISHSFCETERWFGFEMLNLRHEGLRSGNVFLHLFFFAFAGHATMYTTIQTFGGQ